MRSRQTSSMSLSSAAYLGNHSTLDGEPVRPRPRGPLADMDRPIVLGQHDRLGRPTGLGAVEVVELLGMGHEVGAAPGGAGMDNELASDVIERSQHRHLLGLSRRGDAQGRPRPSPRRGRDKDGSTPRFRRRREERCRRLRPGACAIAGASRSDPPRSRSAVPSACRGRRPSGSFFSQRLGQLRAADAHAFARFDFARRRAIVQFRRSATGWSSKGVTTRSAVSLFTGAGPGAMLAFNAATPPLPKSLRHSRTVSSRTPNPSAIRALVQPERVKSTARARSASPRSRDPARAVSAARWSSLAATEDLPPRPHPPE